MKAFVLVRGESGLLHMYHAELWEYIQKNNKHHGFEFVLDHDDSETLRQMQALVNKDLLREE